MPTHSPSASDEITANAPGSDLPVNAGAPATDASSSEGSALSAQATFCSLPVVPERELAPEVDSLRAELILLLGAKWVNGTTLHFYFFGRDTDGRHVLLGDGRQQWRPWTTEEDERDIVRRAFEHWSALGLGLRFQEVGQREEAEIRIGFERQDGAWSYVGREILNRGPNERTMNFGWDLRPRNDFDTALHEIGHTLGFPHEHQNPNAGIVWDEEAVYAAMAKAPNGWKREKTYYNIIRKLAPQDVRGSDWDPDSIMHYPFDAGLIREPAGYRTGLRPPGELSARDVAYARQFYPPQAEDDLPKLAVAQSVKLALAPGEQCNLLIEPPATRGLPPL